MMPHSLWSHIAVDPNGAQLSAWLWLLAALLIGAAIGSFIGVVVARLPAIIAAQHAPISAAHHAHATESDSALAEPEYTQASLSFLAYPASRCEQCQTPIKALHKIPLFSYWHLGGRCATCAKPFGAWLFWIELACALWWGFCALEYGYSWSALVYGFYGSMLIGLGWMDSQTMLLADALTYPTLWVGLLASALGISTLTLSASFWGVVCGYASLWIISRGFFYLRGQVGLGDGDLKLVASIGAWTGASPLIWVLLMASVGGVVTALFWRGQGKLLQTQPIPFGPFLVGAALALHMMQTLTILKPFLQL
jgi:leader peptidase (prepilin peptidase)/N-methyltransferase